jgi:putative ABC transport system permease protein
MESLIQDLRYALRRLLKSPGFTSVVVLSLAVGIGANTAIFSVLNAVFLRPLPYPHAERVANWLERGKPGSFRLPSYPTFRDWQEQSRTVDFAYARGAGLLTPTEDGPARVIAAYVTPEFLGVPPLIGRVPQADENRTGSRVVVISHHLWQSRFAGDRSTPGRTVRLNDESYTVIGVMPLGFALPGL